jgi:alpha-beta hydrolase superfamily lysophospholipase
MTSLKRAGLAAAAAAAPLGLAYRFALTYRARAGYPQPHPPIVDPSAFGLPFEATTVRAGDVELPAWFIPARGGASGPGVALVHGWESARDRTLPNAQFLHAAGFHCLTIDVRGHGLNRAEELPVSAGEFGTDALAAFEALIARPEVTIGAISGHSMGAIGAILAAAADARVAAVVARLPIPDPIAYPLAWFTTRVYLRPRGHVVGDISATAAIRRYAGPVLLAHGSDDAVVPVDHMGRLARAARDARARGEEPSSEPVETLMVAGGQHSWLYEDPGYRAVVARFLARHLGGPLEPDDAARVAEATPARRVPEGEQRFTAVEATPGGFRSLADVARPGATRVPVLPTSMDDGATAGPDDPSVDEPGLG